MSHCVVAAVAGKVLGKFDEVVSVVGVDGGYTEDHQTAAGVLPRCEVCV